MNKFLFAISLLFLAPGISLASPIKVRPGETLSEIAKKYNVSVSSLMRINGISDPNSLYIGQKIYLPDDIKEKTTSNKSKHIVIAGESISTISKFYKVKEKDLINLNKLTNPNQLFVGQTLDLPIDAKEPKSIRQSLKKETSQNDKTYHIVKEGENLYTISKAYNTSLKSIINENKIANPSLLKPGDKLLITLDSSQKSNNEYNYYSKESNQNSSEWRTYGPLQVNWSNWKFMNDGYVAPTIHKNGSALYLAINCSLRKINSTGSNGAWRNWFSPVTNFEEDLVNDLCKAMKRKS